MSVRVKIELDVCNGKLEMTKAEAEELSEQLREALGEKDVIVYPPVVVPSIWPYRYEPPPTWTWTTSNTNPFAAAVLTIRENS